MIAAKIRHEGPDEASTLSILLLPYGGGSEKTNPDSACLTAVPKEAPFSPVFETLSKVKMKRFKSRETWKLMFTVSELPAPQLVCAIIVPVPCGSTVQVPA